MKCKMLIWGIVCLFMIGMTSCKKETVEPAESDPQIVVVDTIPGDSITLGNMDAINGVYFGTYRGGNIPNIFFMDSIYAAVDSIGVTGYEIKIYNDRTLNDFVLTFSIHFEELLFKPCDIGIPMTYYRSWGTASTDAYNNLEVINCDSIDVSKQGAGRGGCPIYGPINGFVGNRVN